MRLFFFIIFNGLLFLLAGCSSTKVKSDYDPDADFSQFKTYQWISGIKVNQGDELSKHPSVLKIIQASVDKELESKGFQKAEEGTDPDFLVAVHAAVKEQLYVDQVAGASSLYYPWWGPGGGYVSMNYSDEGTLVVDIIDFKAKKISWRGMGKKSLKTYRDSQTAEKQEASDKIVSKIMMTFPPK